MNALYIVDPNKTGAEHSSFNAATIRAPCPCCITANSAMAATVTGAVFDVTNQEAEMFSLKNSFLEEVAIGTFNKSEAGTGSSFGVPLRKQCSAIEEVTCQDTGRSCRCTHARTQ